MATTAVPSTTRRAILITIKRRGEARAEELAEALAITPSAVRQHLAALQSEGLVSVREERNGPGRPKHWYAIAPQAESMFPKTYGELTVELLDYAADEDGALVDRLFDRRRERRVVSAKARLAGKPFEARVTELAAILDEDGYLASVERAADGAWRIIEHNCAILEVALRYGQACSSELGFLREVMPDCRIERVSHMTAGAHHCAYEVRPRGRSRAGAAAGRSS